MQQRVIFFLILLAASAAYADVIYNKQGGTLKGLVVEEHRDRIVVNTEEGEKMIPRAEVDEIFYSEPERNHLYLGTQALEEGDAGAALGFFQKALQVNPLLEEANDAIRRLNDLREKQRLAVPQNPLEALRLTWGMELVPSEPLTRVLSLSPSSPAAGFGLAEQDGLLAVWSSSLAYQEMEQAALALFGPPGTTLKLTIEREWVLPKAACAGLKLGMQRQGLTVFSPEPSGASGLKNKDRIVQIEGQSTRYMPLARAQQKIEQSNSDLKIVIHRDLIIQRP